MPLTSTFAELHSYFKWNQMSNSCDTHLWKHVMCEKVWRFTPATGFLICLKMQKKHTVFWSVESWCFSTCFNHQTLKYWEKPMFQHVSTCFPNVSIIFSNQWENPPGFFRVVPQILYSGLFVRFAWAVQPRNYILASCPETQCFSLEKFHGATSNSWFISLGGKWWWSQFLWGKIHFYDVPTNMDGLFLGKSDKNMDDKFWVALWLRTPPWTSTTKVTPPMYWPRATSFGGRSWSVFRVHIGG